MAAALVNNPQREERRLGVDLGFDLTAAFIASIGVSPFVSIIDVGIIQNASGAKRLKDSLIESTKEFLFTWRFAMQKSFHIVSGVYFVTYATANITDTLCSAQKIDSKYPKFVNTSAVNIVSCVAKDRTFTRMFGLKPPTRLPLRTYAMFGTRDSLTILASFTIPPYIASHLQNQGYSKEVSLNTSQLVCPIMVQFVSTPLHLIGLDLYNNHQRTPGQRLAFMRKEYVKSAAARMARISPAFGIGGVLSRALREGLNPNGVPPTFNSLDVEKQKA